MHDRQRGLLVVVVVVKDCWLSFEKEPREGPTRDAACARGCTSKRKGLTPGKRYEVAFPVEKNGSTAPRCRLMRRLLLLA
jgi:hypothetical protein